MRMCLSVGTSFKLKPGWISGGPITFDCGLERYAHFAEYHSEYDIASLFMVSFYCFVTKAYARRPGAAVRVERRRRER